ncbi:MAG: hypothetical protein ACLGIJ_13350 [Candidatus Limnocylindria bacterium]
MIARVVALLKRWLWPLRPILHPVWRLLRPLFGRNAAVRAAANTPPATLRIRHEPGTIRPLTKREFTFIEANDSYYRGRWTYLSVAGEQAAELIAKHDLHTALELGPWARPLIVGADAMDRIERPDLQREGRLVVHDATVAPWPIDDKAYDLFVGLQVFEHLKGKQAIAFSEVRRVARHAIISLPIDWVLEDTKNSHHGLTEEFVRTWFLPVEPTRVVLGNGGPKKRLVFVFEDLPA